MRRSPCSIGRQRVEQKAEPAHPRARAAGIDATAAEESCCTSLRQARASVHRLPPDLDGPQSEQAKLEVVGESDRMTLRFVNL